MKPVLLLVEDEAALARGLELNFDLEGWETVGAATLAQARAALRARRPDLVLLDLNLPDGDGLELLREWKDRDPSLAVLVLTARAADEDRIAGLSRGADDYVTKPFHLQELVLRVRNLLRRTSVARDERRAPGENGETGEIRVGTAVLDPARSLLVRGGARQLLTEMEMALLVYLWRRRGRWVTREELLVNVWGYVPETSTRTVDIFVSRLRRMLGDDAGSPSLLLTRRGVGYMLADDGDG